VHVGQEVGVTVTPFPDEVFTAHVDVVSPVIDPTTRTLRVKASLDDSGGRLRPGLFARADLGVNVRGNVAVIPEEAVLQRTDGSVVFELLDGSRVARRVVEVAAFRKGVAELAGGLAPGALVVTRGHTGLVDGAVVDVVEGPGGDGAAGATPVAEAQAP
jgi:membrane fusion protein (multidrug efflux system)